MKGTRIVIGTFACVLIGHGPALAHEQALHKGRPTEGTVAAVSEKGFTLETAKGSVPVAISESTRFERGDQKVAKTDVRQGDHVAVFGTVLADGEIVAREIVVHPTGGGGKHSDGHDAE